MLTCAKVFIDRCVEARVGIPNYGKLRKHHGGVLSVGGVLIPQVRATFLIKGVGATQHSIGVYRYKGKVIFCAWGLRHQKHCSYHAVRHENGLWLNTQNGCPKIQLLKNKKLIVGIIISAESYRRKLLFHA